MDNTEPMTYSEQLHALLDGEIEPGEASSLFYQLAGNAELQNEMQDLLTLKKTLPKLQQTPPDRLKKKIFVRAGLGFIPSASISSFYDRFTRIALNRGIIAAFSILAGMFITFMLYKPQDIAYIEAAGITPPPPHIIARIDSQAETQPAPTRGSTINRIIQSGDVVSAIPDGTHSSLAQSNHTDNTSNSAPTETSDNTNQNSISLLTINPKNIVQLRSSRPITSNYTKISIINNFSDVLKNFSIQLRSFMHQNYPDLKIPPLYNPTINNFGISLIYQIDEHNSLGLEIGQENFIQEYNGRIDNTLEYYQQNFLGFWGGILYQYSFNRLNDAISIQPIARVFLGGTVVGPLVKLMVGVRYDLSNKFALLGGAEAGGLFYTYQDHYFWSQMIGLTGGFIINF